MVNILRSNYAGMRSLSSGERVFFDRDFRCLNHFDYTFEERIVERDVVIVHPHKCKSQYCEMILSKMQYSKMSYKRVSSELVNNKWDAQTLREIEVFPMDAPFVINKLGDIQYAERYSSFFNDGQVVNPVFNEQVKPELAAEYGWEYGGESDKIKTFIRSSCGQSSDIFNWLPGETFLEKCEKHLPGFNAHCKSALESPVFHSRGTPVEGRAAKVHGLDIYLITSLSNKDKLNFYEFSVSKLTEIKRKCWLPFIKNEIDHEAIETSLEDWKKIDPLFEKMNVFTEKVDFVLNQVSERFKARDYADDNRMNYSAESAENIQQPFGRDGYFQDKRGGCAIITSNRVPPLKSSRFGSPEGSLTSDKNVSVEKKVEAIKKIKQFLSMIRPDLEQLVLINKRREYLQVNSFMSNFLRLLGNEANKRSEDKHLMLIDEKLASMPIVSLADIGSVFFPVFQGSKEIPVFGGERTELLVLATDILFLISDLCFNAANRLDTMQSASCEETAS